MIPLHLFEKPQKSNQKNYKDEFNKTIKEALVPEKITQGAIFFMGAYLATRIAERENAFDDNLDKSLDILNLFAKATGKFDDLRGLDESNMIVLLRNTALKINQMASGSERQKELTSRTSLQNDSNTLKPDKDRNKIIIDESHYPDSDEFNLVNIQNVYNNFLAEIGKQTTSVGLNNETTYKAGFAFRMLLVTIKDEETIRKINELSAYLPPLLLCLVESPIDFSDKLFWEKSESIFSKILLKFMGGFDSPFFFIYEPVFRYHECLLYDTKTGFLLEEWNFGQIEKESYSYQIFIHALQVRKTPFATCQKLIQNEGQIWNSNILRNTCSVMEFLEAIMEVLFQKYGFEARSEFIKESSTDSPSKSWRYRGEYIQFLAVLFYETTLHAIAAKKII